MNGGNQIRRWMRFRSFLCISLSLLLCLPMQVVAKAKPDAATQAFSMVLEGMNARRRLQFCEFVAKQAADQASEAPDIALRSTRHASALKLNSRVASSLAKANEALTPEQVEAIERENLEALGLLSYAPSPLLATQINQAGEDLVGLFLTDIVAKCDTLLDSMGVAAAHPASAVASPVPRIFKWRGKTAQEAFEGTGLALTASKICTGSESKAADFAGVDFAARGKDGVSLLDWAFECRDRSAFKALLEAGFDAEKPSQFGDPPLVSAAELNDTWYLNELLAHGVSPNSLGHLSTALEAAYEPLEDGGGKRFQLLRTAGASLNFPEPDKSMWNAWSRFARWEMILANWSEFKSDPVELGWSVGWELDKPNSRGNKRALKALKDRLIADYGVCFPVGSTIDLARNERGFYVQPNCPKHDQ